MEVSVVSVSVSVCVLSLRLQVTKKEPQKLAASLPVQLQKHRKNAVGGRGREREGRRSRRNCERRSRQTELNSTIAMFMLWLKEGGRARQREEGGRETPAGSDWRLAAQSARVRFAVGRKI